MRTAPSHRLQRSCAYKLKRELTKFGSLAEAATAVTSSTGFKLRPKSSRRAEKHNLDQSNNPWCPRKITAANCGKSEPSKPGSGCEFLFSGLPRQWEQTHLAT